MRTDEIYSLEFIIRSDGWNSSQGSTSRNRSFPGTLVHTRSPVWLHTSIRAIYWHAPPTTIGHYSRRSDQIGDRRRSSAKGFPDCYSPECKWPPGIRDLQRLWDRIWSQPRLGGSADWWLRRKSGVRLQKARSDIESSPRCITNVLQVASQCHFKCTTSVL
jgi:hypothetical protein